MQILAMRMTSHGFTAFRTRDRETRQRRGTLQWRGTRPVCAASLALMVWGAAACGEEPSALILDAAMDLTLTNLAPLDPAMEGTYELWVYGGEGSPASAGRFAVPGTGGEARIPFVLPIGGADRIVVTLEPPGDDDASPSEYVLLAGRFQGDVARLTIDGAITSGAPLETHPGAHSLFTSSNNIARGYPSFEDAGLWLFNIDPDANRHGNRFVKLTPLERRWFYEGWIVRDYGTPDAVWISYGKYRPDLEGFLTSRDNTGSGLFSSDMDFRNGGVEDVPGDEWTTNTFDMPVPGGLELPLELDTVDPASGEAVWTHVITIEPAFDELEPLLSEEPFILRPYRNPIGEGRPGDPRRILYQANEPSGVVRPAG